MNGFEAIFGPYWWFWLSVLTFLAGWWWGRRVVSLVLDQTRNSKMARLPQPVAAGNHESGGTRMYLERTRDELQKQKAALRERDKESIQYASQLAGVRAELDTVNRRRAGTEADLVRTDKELNEQRAKLAALQKDFDKLNASNVKLSEDHAKVSVELGTVGKSAKALETEKAAIAADLDKRKNELETVLRVKQIADKELEAAKHKLNTMQSDMDALRQGRATAESKLETSEKAYRDTLALLEAKRNEEVALAAEVAKLTQNAAAVEKATAEQAAKNGALQADLDASAQAKAERDAALKARDGELAEKNTQLELLMTQLSAVESERNAARATLQSRETELAQIKTLNQTVLGQMDAIEAEKAAGHVALQAREKLILEIKTQHESLRNQLSALEAEKAAFQTTDKKELVELNAAHARLNESLALANSARTEAEVKLRANELELSETIVQLDRVRTESAGDAFRAKENIDRAVSEKAAAESTARELEAALKQARAELQELRARLDSPVVAAAAPVSDTVPVPALIPAIPETLKEAPTGAVTPALSGRIIRDRQDETPHSSNSPQHLSDVKGIGSGFETKLYAAGIGSYWDLSRLSNDEMTRILELNEGLRKRFKFDAVRADALRLAEESHAKGRTWTRSKPDDLEPLKGLGHTFEKRLYDAGICTYTALALLTPDELHDICRPPAHFKKPDYAVWIEQAKTLAQK